MSTVPHPGPDLLREAATLLAADPTALPRVADVQRELLAAALHHTTDVALAADMATLTWDLVEARWARQGWLRFGSVAGWVTELRQVADWYDRLGAYYDRVTLDCCGGGR